MTFSQLKFFVLIHCSVVVIKHLTCLYDVYPYTEMSSSHTSFVQAILFVSVFVGGGGGFSV